ncbi:MAG: YraN family protein [Pseudomonadota bacterium]
MGEPAALGQRAEKAALLFLETHGLSLVARNYRCRWGEIDLIVGESSCLVFVEVRYRQASGFGGAAATVSRSKQRRLLNAASHFLSRHPHFNSVSTRFDVIGIDREGSEQTIQWIKDAFRPGD